MDVVLGVAVTGPVARLALLEPGARGDVIDQSVVDLEDNPVGKLTETVVGTSRLLADENHRLVGTRLCWPDGTRAAQLQQALQHSGVSNVAVLSESQAVAALMRAAGRPGAALVMDDATATLTVLGPAAGDPDAPPTMLAQAPLAGASGADATAALDTMLANLAARPDAPGDVYLVGASPALDQVAERFRDASTMRVEVADDPTFALARGAAIAATAVGDATAMAPAIGLTGDATAMAPAAIGDETTALPTSGFAGPDAEEPQLAYSMADEPEFDDYGDDYGDEYDEYGDFDEEAEPARLSRRSLLIGNAVIAFAVIGLASLATAIAVAVRPTASQQPVVGVQNGTPGKFMPILPTQQQAPLPPPPVDQPNAGFQGGTVPAPTGGGSVPQQVSPPSGGGAPVGPVPAPVPGAPGGPGGPGFVPGGPGPIVPIPIPVPIPFPGWRPNYPPYNPPTTTYQPPTTTYSPPTTTHEPPTTTYSPPTTTHEPPTTTYSPPTTTHAPPTTTYSPPSTTHEAPTNTYTPPTHTQQTVPPTRSQQPLVPQLPRGGEHHGF
jgi:hypothetical protein